MRSQFLFLSLLLAVGCHAKTNDNEGVVRFSYIPFEIETFVPVRVADVKEVSKCRFSLDIKDGRVRALAAYLVGDGRQAKFFGSKVVRLEIDGLQGETFFVDKDGAFWGEKSGLTGRIPVSLFPKFKSDVGMLLPFSMCGDL